MHIVDLASPIKASKEWTIPTGESLAEDISGAQFLIAADGGTMNKLHPEEVALRKFNPKEDWNDRGILVMRTGGFGDLVLLTPVLAELKRRWPKCKIAFSCFKNFEPALHNLGLIDVFVSYPVPILEARQYDAWVLMENAIEKNPEAEKHHMTDIFAGKFGFDETDSFSRHPLYVVTEREKIWAEETYPRKSGVQRLVVQAEAKARNRCYPEARISAVVDHFSKLDGKWEILLVGEPKSLQVEESDRVKNLTAHGTTFRQSCAVLATADCVLGSDSAMIHVAGALDIPAVGLFGPFLSKLRTAYSPSVEGIDGKGACAPCFHHVRRGQEFPAHGPCANKGFCVVLDGIAPKKVIDRVVLRAKQVLT